MKLFDIIITLGIVVLAVVYLYRRATKPKSSVCSGCAFAQQDGGCSAHKDPSTENCKTDSIDQND